MIGIWVSRTSSLICSIIRVKNPREEEIMSNGMEETPISIQPVDETPKKARIRRKNRSMNPSRKKMTVPVNESFHEIHEMNQKALKVLAKQI